MKRLLLSVCLVGAAVYLLTPPRADNRKPIVGSGLDLQPPLESQGKAQPAFLQDRVFTE